MVKSTKNHFGVSKTIKISNSNNPNRQIPKNKTDATGKGMGKLRSNSTIRRLLMYGSKIKRDSDGNIVKGSVIPEAQRIPKGGVARVQPDRRWFGNTRVVGQKELDQFREELGKKAHDPYTVVLKQASLPYSLLQDVGDKSGKKLPGSSRKTNVGDHGFPLNNRISFQEAFGEKSVRKKPRLLGISDLAEYSEKAHAGEAMYQEEKDGNSAIPEEEQWNRNAGSDPIFNKGQSKRIWSELYKVIDASDVVVQVLDARDPQGTRSPPVERYLRTEKPHKHLVFVLNKCDLIPTWATARWVRVLSQEYPTLAFHASIMNPFGKGSLIQLLRQFAQLHQDKKNISVGFIGYPNVGV